VRGNGIDCGRLESWFATKTAQFLLGIKLKDPMSGYFLVWRKDFSEVKIN